MNFDARHLYELLPVLYRLRDAGQGEPLNPEWLTVASLAARGESGSRAKSQAITPALHRGISGLWVGGAGVFACPAVEVKA